MADFLDYGWLRVMLMVAARHDLSRGTCRGEAKPSRRLTSRRHEARQEVCVPGFLAPGPQAFSMIVERRGQRGVAGQVAHLAGVFLKVQQRLTGFPFPT